MSTQNIEDHYYNVLFTGLKEIQDNNQLSNREKFASYVRFTSTVNTYYNWDIEDYKHFGDLNLSKYEPKNFTQSFYPPNHKTPEASQQEV